MDSLFDSLKAGDEVDMPETPAEQHAIPSPLKFFESEDELSRGELKPTNGIQAEESSDPLEALNKTTDIVLKSDRNLRHIRKCFIKLPKDKNGDLLQRLKDEFFKSNKAKRTSRRLPSPRSKSMRNGSASPKDRKKEMSGKTKAKIFFKVSGMSKIAKRHHTRRSDSRFSRSSLIQQFGIHYLQCHVRVCRSRDPLFGPQKSKKTRNLKNVSFNEMVEFIGDSSGEDNDEDCDYQTPGKVRKGENGKPVKLATSTPYPTAGSSGSSKRDKTSFSPLRIGESPRKDQFKLANEKMPKKKLPVDDEDNSDSLSPSAETPKKKLPVDDEDNSGRLSPSVVPADHVDNENAALSTSRQSLSSPITEETPNASVTETEKDAESVPSADCGEESILPDDGDTIDSPSTANVSNQSNEEGNNSKTPEIEEEAISNDQLLADPETHKETERDLTPELEDSPSLTSGAVGKFSFNSLNIFQSIKSRLYQGSPKRDSASSDDIV